jgi:energy-coupling factor transporter ATP-binding protein EcfA2
MFQTFDIKSIRPNSVIVIDGRRASGKSTMAREIVRKMEAAHKVVSSGTATGLEFYGSEFQHYVPHLHDNVLTQHPTTETHALVVDDDCYLERSELVGNIATNGRFYKTTLILTASSRLSPKIRGNTDYAVLFHSCDIKRQYDDYGCDAFPTYREFAEAMDSLKPHQCLILDLTRLNTVPPSFAWVYQVNEKQTPEKTGAVVEPPKKRRRIIELRNRSVETYV